MHHTILLGLYGLAALALYKILSILITNRQHAARAKALNCAPAPTYPNTRILGLNHLQMMQEADRQQLFPDMLEERQEYMNELTGRLCPTHRIRMLGQEMFFTSDPENIKAMLATQFEDFDVGPVRRGVMVPSLGHGIFVQDGKAWEHSRAMIRPNFVRDQVSDLELEERHVQELFQVMPVRSDGWTDLTDIQTLFFRLTIDSACEFLFGESVNSQLSEAGLKVADEKNRINFALHFDRALTHLSKRFRYGDQYWVHNPREFKEDNKAIHQFIQYYVDLALAKPIDEKKVEEGQAGKKERYVFLDALAQQTRDPDELRSQLLNILLAGRDTTSSLLSWLFHLLLRHPDVFTKLRATILDTFGTYENPQNITFATLKDCKYLQNCLNESLRIWPVVPGNTRRSNKATTLPRGGGPDGLSPVYIKPNTDVNYSVHVMHRRTDLWGPDAADFKPERWESGRRPGWEFLPFNGGPRICIGQQFALTEASYVAVRLLQRFDRIETVQGELEGRVRSNLSLTNCPSRVVRLRMREARS